MKKSALIILNSAPFTGLKAQEGLELLLSAPAFYQKVAVLFQADAVYQLLDLSAAENHGYKDFTAAYKAFDLYDIEKIYVNEEDLAMRGLTPQQLKIQAQLLNKSKTAQLQLQYDIILKN